MNMFTAAVKNELLKVKTKKCLQISLITITVMTVLLVVLQYTARSYLGFLVIEWDQFTKTVLEIMLKFIVPLFAFVMGIDSLASEKNQGTLNRLLTSPASRFKLYTAKLVSLYMVNLIMLCIIFVIASIGSLFSISSSFLTSTIEAFTLCILAMIPLGIISLWGLFLGQFFSNGSIAIGMGMVSIFLINAGQIFVEKLYFLEPMTYMNFYELLPYTITYYIMLASAGMLKLITTES